MDCDSDEFNMKEVFESTAEYILTFHREALRQWFNQTDEETVAAQKRLKIMKIVDFVLWKSVYLGMAYSSVGFLKDYFPVIQQTV